MYILLLRSKHLNYDVFVYSNLYFSDLVITCTPSVESEFRWFC